MTELVGHRAHDAHGTRYELWLRPPEALRALCERPDGAGGDDDLPGWTGGSDAGGAASWLDPDGDDGLEPAFDAVVAAVWHDEPADGALGLWWRTTASCDHAGPGCACGPTVLGNVVGALDPVAAAAAIAAHVTALGRLEEHLERARTLAEAGDVVAVGAALDATECPGCLFGGAEHHDDLEDAYSEAALELAQALTAHAVRFELDGTGAG